MPCLVTSMMALMKSLNILPSKLDYLKDEGVIEILSHEECSALHTPRKEAKIESADQLHPTLQPKFIDPLSKIMKTRMEKFIKSMVQFTRISKRPNLGKIVFYWQHGKNSWYHIIPTVLHVIYFHTYICVRYTFLPVKIYNFHFTPNHKPICLDEYAIAYLSRPTRNSTKNLHLITPTADLRFAYPSGIWIIIIALLLNIDQTKSLVHQIKTIITIDIKRSSSYDPQMPLSLEQRWVCFFAQWLLSFSLLDIFLPRKGRIKCWLHDKVWGVVVVWVAWYKWAHTYILYGNITYFFGKQNCVG